ncbi:MAG: MBL fold metallo-hydrolase [Pirellulales bacterium]|nr:MBL fold metallo-hydrolase [Pirellulales bacterium]
MTEPATELLLRVNGIQAAFGIELGFDSQRANEGRADDPYRQANVSYSLLQRRNGRIVRHTLIDVGMGVVPSLLEFEVTHGACVVHDVLLTHPHYDHFGQIDWLSMALLRNGREDQPRPLPIYATRACWEAGPNAIFRYLAERSDFRPVEPGIPVVLGDLILTPFAVDHGPKAPGALGFVAQYGKRKIVVSGDFLHVPDEENSLLFEADVCFLDANTWHPAEWTWHQSVLGNLRLIEKWKPRRTYFVHYSGYEDRNHPNHGINGPMGRDRFCRELHHVAGESDIQLARHAMLLGGDTPWPD